MIATDGLRREFTVEAKAKPLTVKQVAERWGVSRSIVYALVASGVLAHVRVGLGRGTIRISVDAVIAYEQNHVREDEKEYADHFA